MIKIEIATNGKGVFDSFKKKDITLKEVAVVLLRLKQIEHELIKIEFDEDLRVDEDAEAAG